MLINLNEAKELANRFLGSERKTTILYHGEVYMLKYPDPIKVERFKDLLSYKNNQFSEHIGCQVFKACGFDTQDTLLGKYTAPNGKEKLVVACKDFTQDGSVLYEFAKLANQALVEKVGRDLTIEDFYIVVTETAAITDKSSVIERFWDVFVVDALIGNRDRHFGNFGLIEKDGVLANAPVYDCGSSLSALLDDESMQEDLTKPGQFRQNTFQINSCYRMNGKRVFYHEIFKDPPEDLAAAIWRVVPKIDMDKIHEIVDATPEMSDVRKQYLKAALALRYKEILQPALKRVLQ